ncbi:MAG: helix-turn-helix transcriptional regulator [Deferrisomatales bacterium]
MEDLRRLLDLSCSISAGLGVDEYRGRVVELLLSVFRSEAGNFFIANRDAETLNLASVLTQGIGDQWLRAFADYYHYLDPYLQRPLSRVGVTVLDEIVDREQFEKTQYYNDFLKPQGIYHQLAVPLSVGHRCVGVIALFRPRAGPGYTPQDKEKAALMVPYLASGLERALIFEHTRQKNWILELSLRGRGGPGILVLDRQMNPVFVNDEAQALLGGGAPAAGGGCPRLPERLGAACTRAAQDLAGFAPGPGGEEEVAWLGPDGHTLAARLSVISGHFLGQPEHFLVVKVGRRYGGTAQFSPALVQQYRLTPREAEVLAEAVKGASNLEIGENLFISVHTVENHLKRIFRKTGVKNRTELSYKFLE